MPLETGTRIGRYEIRDAIGAGGMGEVYRAHDARLARDVAIKVLPDGLRDNSERLARFEREAKLLAAVNHPNIAAIYGIEEGHGLSGLVLELVEGPTLADRLAQAALNRNGGLPFPEALTIARQVADALDAAHERGIVHRDLKPANIKVTIDGVVKVLDFGLAKSGTDDEPADSPRRDSSLSQSPTLAPDATREGAILGTAAYMSPEQARGYAVNKRADIWAFGCVLYEMLTGSPAFRGSTAADIIANVLQGTPDWTAVPKSAPAAIGRLLRRCLEKDPKRRLHDIADARLEIDDVLTAGGNGTAVASPAIARDVEFQRLTDFVGLKESPAISPDGKMVAFVALMNGTRQIWIRMLAGGTPLQVTRDAGDHEQPRWTPDSSALLYYTRARAQYDEGTIWEIAALGGPPRRVTTSLGGADISHDGQRVAAFAGAGGSEIELVTVARNGSARNVLARLNPDYLYRLPRWSPDDTEIAYQRLSIDAFDMEIEVVTVATGALRTIARAVNIHGLSWLPDSAGIVYGTSRGSTVLYPPTFNLRRVNRDGTGDCQLTFGDWSQTTPDVHASGKLVVTRLRSRSDIWRFPTTGTAAENTRQAVRVTSQTGQAQTPSVSPDGSEVVYLSDNGGHGNLWVAATDGSSARQITFEQDPNAAVGIPLWSPRGDWIVFICQRGFQTGLYAIRPDGGGLRELVNMAWAACWSPDGEWVYYSQPQGAQLTQKKMAIDGGAPLPVNDTGASSITVAADGTIFCVTRIIPDVFGRWAGELEIARLSAPRTTLARVSGTRVPVSPILFQVTLSPDGAWLAAPLVDGATANICAWPSAGGPMKALTEFGDRTIQIARAISWSADSQFVFAAVAETDTDIVLYDGLLR